MTLQCGLRWNRLSVSYRPISFIVVPAAGSVLKAVHTTAVDHLHLQKAALVDVIKRKIGRTRDYVVKHTFGNPSADKFSTMFRTTQRNPTHIRVN
jgi:hypothetical protein